MLCSFFQKARAPDAILLFRFFSAKKKICIFIYPYSFKNRRIQELRVELDETMRAKDKLEKDTYVIMDELRALKSKVDHQASDFTTVAIDLRNKSRKLEDDTRQVVSRVWFAKGERGWMRVYWDMIEGIEVVKEVHDSWWVVIWLI